MYKKLAIALVLFFFQKANAQKPEELLEKWVSQSPVQKVYLHLDRDSYVAGETAFFHAYLSSDWQPDTISTSVYTELVNGNRSIGDNKVFPVFAGGANGHLEIPDTLQTGWYTIRAWTATMMNSNAEFIFQKQVFVYGKKQVSVPPPQPSVAISFFPEGGNMVNGLNGSVAFKAIDQKGLPVMVSGKIKNSKGETITSFSSNSNGMGMFDLKPEEGDKYYAEADKMIEKFNLPGAAPKGIALTVLPQAGGYFYEVQQKTDDPAFMVSYMLGQMQHHVVFRQQFNTVKPSFQGAINTQKLNSGILQVTFFNKDGMPLAERLCFINNGEYTLPATLQTDTLNFTARAKNRFSILLPDTVTGSISVSITDADYPGTGNRPENIYTSLLLTSDINGYVHNPVWYFTTTKDSAEAGLDLLMMTNGWRRFRWTELSANKTSAIKDGAYITLQGRIFLKGTKRPFSEKQVLLMVASLTGQKKRNTYMLETDKEGNYKIDSLLFFGRSRLLFIDIRGKKSQYIDVTLNSDSLTRSFLMVPVRKATEPITDNRQTGKNWQEDFDAIMKENGLMLEAVTVKAKKKTPMQQLDDTYTTGMFSGDATKAIDLVNTDEALNYNNIFDYLQNRVNGLIVTTDGADYGVFYRQGPSISSMGNIPMIIFLDEIETDISVVAAIPANQVALVKVYSSFVGGWGNAPGGVLSIYTKKGADYISPTSFSNLAFYSGYSVSKEFYAPDYRENKVTEKPDNRITIDWRPSIFVNAINPRIPFSFYNNDRTKSFKVVVEGMTTSGKLIWLEKIII